jgi:hypothetical protein
MFFVVISKAILSPTKITFEEVVECDLKSSVITLFGRP